MHSIHTREVDIGQEQLRNACLQRPTNHRITVVDKSVEVEVGVGVDEGE
jgi:hypothetical protein